MRLSFRGVRLVGGIPLILRLIQACDFILFLCFVRVSIMLPEIHPELSYLVIYPSFRKQFINRGENYYYPFSEFTVIFIIP